jgi:hypothetical protein
MGRYWTVLLAYLPRGESDREWFDGSDGLGIGFPDGRVLVGGEFDLDALRNTQEGGEYVIGGMRSVSD